MSQTEALESAAITSVSAKGFNPNHWSRHPFRAPHHTASAIALAGGGSPPKPGEISLAHHGVLFLDELPEFDPHALEILREPLETATITISGAAHQTQFPAQFQIIAAMNPCPCGYLGDPGRRCRRTDAAIQRYRARISGPLLDRLDLHVTLQRISANDLAADTRGEPSSLVATRVAQARAIQITRQQTHNARLDHAALMRHCALGSEATAILERATHRFSLSARAYHRILKVARTIADLDDSPRHRPDADQRGASVPAPRRRLIVLLPLRSPIGTPITCHQTTAEAAIQGGSTTAPSATCFQPLALPNDPSPRIGLLQRCVQWATAEKNCHGTDFEPWPRPAQRTRLERQVGGNAARGLRASRDDAGGGLLSR